MYFYHKRGNKRTERTFGKNKGVGSASRSSKCWISNTEQDYGNLAVVDGSNKESSGGTITGPINCKRASV